MSLEIPSQTTTLAHRQSRYRRARAISRRRQLGDLCPEFRNSGSADCRGEIAWRTQSSTSRSIARARTNGRNRVENCKPIFSNRRKAARGTDLSERLEADDPVARKSYPCGGQP